MAKSKLADTLTPLDAAFLNFERPNANMNIGGLAIYEGQLSMEALIELLEAKIHLAPRYQQRLVIDPLHLGQPRWAFDPAFDVSNHVFRIALDPQRSEEELVDVAGHLASMPLSRAKPMWEFHVIEGLQGNRTGLFFRVHHCMVDGASAADLLNVLLDISPRPGTLPARVDYNPPALPGRSRRMYDVLQGGVAHSITTLKGVRQDVALFKGMLGDRQKRRQILGGLATLISDNLVPIKRFPFNRSASGNRQLVWAEFSLAEVRAIRASCGGSVNDVMLAVVGAAVARYLDLQEDETKEDILRVMVPVSMRVAAEKSSLGNRVSLILVDVPLWLADPVARLHAVTAATAAMKQSEFSKGMDTITNMTALIPPPLQVLAGTLTGMFGPLALRAIIPFHMVCTNVPGPQIPLYLMGHKMIMNYGFVPIGYHMGVNCVIFSYNQQISVTLTVDPAVVPDAGRFKELLEESFLALRHAANVKPIAPIALQPDRIEAKKDQMATA
jgi:WS/DGAT/MGAT family acyltransferase